MSRFQNYIGRKHLQKTRRPSKRNNRSHSYVRSTLAFETLDERRLLAADLALVDDGLQNGYFADLQATINTEILSVRAPLIGDALASEIGGTTEVSSQFVSSVGEKLLAVSVDGAVSVADVQSQLAAALGIAAEAIEVIGQDGDSDIRFMLTLSDTQSYEAAVDLDLVGADPEIELLLGTENQVDLDLTWTYDLAFGVREDADGTSSFYIDTSADKELTIDYIATVRNDFESGKGRVGVFVAEISEGDGTSQFNGSYALDIAVGEFGEATVSGSLTGTGEANLRIDASFFPSFLPEGSDGLINLGVMADGRVAYVTNMIFTSDGELDTSANQVTVAFDDVRLDLGKLYDDFVDPVITNIQNSLKPIKPVVDFLTEPLPIISDLFELGGSGPVTALTLGGYSANDPIVKAINVVDAILNYRGLPNAGAENIESLFSFELSKQGFDPETARDKAEAIQDNLTKLENGDLLQLADKHKNPEENAEWQSSLSWNAEFGGSIDLPFLSDFETLGGFLLGDTSSEFFTFDVAADFSINFDVSLPIAPLLNLVQLNAGFGFDVTIDLGGGYDALGVQRLAAAADFSSEESLRQSLQDNRDFLLHGFYLDDNNSNAPGASENGANDKPEVTLGVNVQGGLSAGIDLGLLQFTVGGNIVFEGNLEFDLNDLPDPNFDSSLWPDASTPIWTNQDTPNEWNYDGRVRIPELTTIVDADPGALFNVDGDLQVGLDATLEIGVIGITVVSEKWELFRIKLVDGSIRQANDAEIIQGFNPPQLGSLDNGVLNLFAGNESGQRNVEPNVVDETFIIQSLGESKEGGETLMVIFESPSGEKYTQLFTGVTNIVALGGSGNDTLRTLPGVVSTVNFLGGAGNDLLVNAGSGTALLYGNDGNDTLVGGSGADQLFGGAGDDQLDGGSGDDTLEGGAGDDRLLGSAGNDILRGQDDADFLDGGYGEDTLYGGGGHDILRGGLGSDRVYGEAGNDMIQFGFFLQDDNAVDEISGGANFDVVEIYGTDQADNFLIQQLNGGTFQVTNAEYALFQFSLPEEIQDRDIEELRVSGLGGDDRIEAIGNLNVNRLRLDGGDGNDTLIGASSRNLLVGGAGNDTLIGGDDRDVLRGGAGDDTLRGGANNDALYGDAGHDFIFGEAGSDSSYGGEGNDTIEAGDGIVGDFIFGGGGNDTLLGGTGVDFIYGGEGNDLIDGGGLSDSLFGDGGDDRLIGRTGRDYLAGGEGNDELFAMNDETPFDSISNIDWNAAYQELLQREIEITNTERPLIISQIADIEATIFELEANDPENEELPGLREQLADLLDQKLYLANERVVINKTQIDIDPDQTIEVDVLDGGSGDDRLRGSEFSDRLYGGSGNDIIEHSAGNDVVFGGPGLRDQYVIFGTAGDDSIEVRLENDLAGGTPAIVVSVNGSIEAEANQTEIEVVGVDSRAGNDTIQLLFGVNGAMEVEVDGGTGDDLIDVGTFQNNTVLNGGEGTDRIRAELAASDFNFVLSDSQLTSDQVAHQLAGFEKAELIGNASNNEIDARNFSGDAILRGEDGDDILWGGDGNDTLNGGAGTDKIGAEGNVNFTLTNTQLTGQGVDDLVDIEQAELIGGAGDNVLDARAFTIDRVILRGGDGNDTLYGGARHDLLYGDAGNDRLEGGSLGNDRLYGGPGNDILIGAYDYLYGEDGNDILRVSDPNSGVYNQEMRGGAGNDMIYGGSTSETLYGGPGDDTLVGGAGNDILYGESGADTIYGQTGNDQLFGGTGNDRLFGEAGYDTLYGGSGNDWLFGGTGNDRLYGQAGNDTLNGQAGNDRLYGGSGNDSLYGESGSDYLYGESGNDYLDGGRDGTRDYVYGGSGWDRAVQHTRWVTTWWVFGYWAYQDTLSSTESVSYVGW